jgi:hypothetical protein
LQTLGFGEEDRGRRITKSVEESNQQKHKRNKKQIEFEKEEGI